MTNFLKVLSLLSLLACGAIFGFFYAWVCSTMWGLDSADPKVAISAMQAMNASVRNGVFAPAFFGTPIVLTVTAFFAWRTTNKRASLCFATAAVVYFCFGLILTMAINVPMNEALAEISIPDSTHQAQQIWSEYSDPWQFWNQVRTIASGIALALAAWGSMQIRSGPTDPSLLDKFPILSQKPAHQTRPLSKSSRPGPFFVAPPEVNTRQRYSPAGAFCVWICRSNSLPLCGIT